MATSRPKVPLLPADSNTRRGFEELISWLLRNMVAARDQTGEVYAGAALRLLSIFDIDVSNDEPRLILKDVFSGGSKGTSFSVDALNGGAQTFTITASVSLTDVTNLVGPEPINIRVALGANTLTLSGTNFEGPELSFSGESYCALSIVNFGTGKKTVAGFAYS